MNEIVRTGTFMHTSNGKKYYPFDPRPEDVEVEVIAHHLATQARFNGATQHPTRLDRIFYSVAEHSVYVAWYVELEMKRPDLALEALMHDSPEFLMPDLIRPLKYSPEFREPFAKVEKLNEAVIAQALNLKYPWAKEIKIADEAVCTAEIRQIVPQDPTEDWGKKLHDDSNVAPYYIEMRDPFQAKRLFLTAFCRIISERHKYAEVPERFKIFCQSPLTEEQAR